MYYTLRGKLLCDPLTMATKYEIVERSESIHSIELQRSLPSQLLVSTSHSFWIISVNASAELILWRLLHMAILIICHHSWSDSLIPRRELLKDGR